MSLLTILTNSLWAGLFASGFGVILTAPARALVSCFVCGFMGRCVRDLSIRGGLSQNWATAVAAAVVALLAMVIVRRQTISPVVLVSAVLPIASTVAILNMLLDLMRVSSLTGEALSAASVSLSANAGKASTGTLAIAIGLGAGVAIARFAVREEAAAR